MVGKLQRVLVVLSNGRSLRQSVPAGSRKILRSVVTVILKTSGQQLRTE